MTSSAPPDWHPVQTPAPVAPPPAPLTPDPTSSPAPLRRWTALTIAGALVAVALVGGLAGGAIDHWLTPAAPPASATPPVATTAPPVAAPAPATAPQVNPRAGSAPRQPAATATPTTDPTQLAIQQVIQKGDQEQAQALAAKDPSVMQDTSTSSFYQEQVQTNQDLLNGGVTAIKLDGISWGSISVSGSSATATCWETWGTTYSDGTTEESQDENDYTLVQQNGAWLVQSDDHPNSPTGANGAPGATSPSGANGAPGATSPSGGSPSGSAGQPGSGGAGQPGSGGAGRSGRGQAPSAPRVPASGTATS